MLENLGKELADLFEDVEFIGVQKGISNSVCMFNCIRTGATFCGNSTNELVERLEYIRDNFDPIENRA